MSNKKILRSPNGKLAAGTNSLNPGGRPKGIEKRMREIIEARGEKINGHTVDGWTAMTHMIFDVAMGRKPSGANDMSITVKDRLAAAQFHFDRVHGKAKIQIESDTTLHTTGLASIDVDALSKDELEALEAQVELLAAKAAGKSTGRVLDISPADVLEVEPD
jgi:hypothetical protein